MRSKPEAITLVFDYDGTLHESLRIYAPAFRKSTGALARQGLMPELPLSDAALSRFLGYSAEEMWRRFMPGLPQAVKEVCSQKIGDEMVRLTEEGRAVLYPGALEMLERVKARCRLILLSNCKRSYLEAHRGAFKLDRFFEAFFCAEDYHFIPKWKILRQLRESAGVGRALVIGDRFQDMEAARKNRLPAIGCAYGYGGEQELESAALVVNTCGALCPAIQKAVSLWYPE